MPDYYLTTITENFSAAHLIRGYDGPCAQLHGHNWQVEVEILAKNLDPIGIGIDFKTIRAATKEIIDGVDHRYLNEIPPFDEINPTAENIAKWLYHSLSALFNQNNCQIHAVTLKETDNTRLRYQEHCPL